MRSVYIRGPRQPLEDETRTGVNFVDVLFAIVVGKILDLSVHEGVVPLAGKSQLVLAAFVTVTSWVGYHNSLNRAGYFMRPFSNLPFWQFSIDILLVYVYFLLAVTAEHPRAAAKSGAGGDARPEAILVAVMFVLYVLWDAIAFAMRKSALYERRPITRDVQARRLVSLLGAVVTIITATTVVALQPHSTASVITVDAVLLVTTVLYRLAKEWVTPLPPPRPLPTPT